MKWIYSLPLVGLFANFSNAMDNARFQKFLYSPAYIKLMEKADLASGDPVPLLPGCKELAQGEPKVTLLAPIEFGSGESPIGGSWKHVAPIKGCGRQTALNFYFFAKGAGNIEGTMGVPGETHADLRLQQDALKYAIVGASAKAKNCQKFKTADSHYEGVVTVHGKVEKSEDGRSPEWAETWTLTGCGKSYLVPISFRPDKTGTTIIQEVDKVKLLK